MRVAIIGSGPSGFYAAEALLKAPGVDVDMFDRLPTPFGLVRGGVAPDHQKMKSVIRAYEKVATHPRFRFFGNVMLGRDLQVDELRRCYDQRVYAVGNESDRRLGVPGEELSGSHSATAFVGWYNGHPDFCDRSFDLSSGAAAVIGVGNVAVDVTRILAQDPRRLAGTDIAGYAHAALVKSQVQEVWLLGRRGPAQAAFSNAELKELGELDSADLVVRPEELPAPEGNKNLEYLAARAALGQGTRPKKVYLRFCVSPVELLGEGGRVRGLVLERNRLEPDGRGEVRAVGTGVRETLEVGLVFRAVGYRGVKIPGVPFDEKSGRIPNDGGRVLDEQGRRVPDEYVVGWAKRGPTGLIGTNRQDALHTVQAMAQDRPAAAVDRPDVEPLLRAKGLDYVTFDAWKLLDQHELNRGLEGQKLREKVTTIEEMLRVVSRR